MIRIGIIIGTTRQGRFGDRPAAWIHDIARARGDMAAEIIDLRDHPLPLFDEPAAPARMPPRSDAAWRWNRTLSALDGFVFITAEYNHGISGALKNALDHAYPEFDRKPAACVGYGGLGGTRAVEQLRLVAIELGMAPLREAVHITRDPILAVLRDGCTLAAFEELNRAATAMLDALAWWARLLKAGR